ncbi:ATP-binding cassette domain-containing protein [Embleya sp. NPDC020886]|uniref:ATP-binding cassette domain-containing protein n=1 Tax=Embleya sp. NPDC020886 TaxID=3363980 RepID=UPI0037A4ACFA
MDLHLPAGRTVAVGLNGAGKTTLVKMLCGLYTPDGGRLLVDGTPLTDLDIDRWRERVSGTFQDYARLETSGQHSVGAGDPARMDEAAPVARAPAAADAARLPDRRPDGLASHLGRTYRDGVELSGGQWQRVATARAMMKRTPLLLLLDEPTAALDPVAEHALYERYTGAAREVRHGGGVVLLVSHRFSSVRMADLIVVMRQGRVQDVGSHEELMSRPGEYAEMFQRQADASA